MSRKRTERQDDNGRQFAFDWHPCATVSTAEAALLLDVSQDLILTLIKDGQLEARRKNPLPRSPYRVYIDSIEQLAESWRRQVLDQSTAASRW